MFKPHDWCIFIHIFNRLFVVVISNSSSTLFVMLKFTCEGLHLKKLVDAIGAGNIVKAGTWKLYHFGSFEFIQLPRTCFDNVAGTDSIDKAGTWKLYHFGSFEFIHIILSKHRRKSKALV